MLDARAPRFSLQSTILSAARNVSGNPFGWTIVQSLNLLPELPKARRLVLMLAPQLARGNDDTRTQMSEPDSRFCLVDVLAAGAT